MKLFCESQTMHLPKTKLLVFFSCDIWGQSKQNNKTNAEDSMNSKSVLKKGKKSQIFHRKHNIISSLLASEFPNKNAKIFQRFDAATQQTLSNLATRFPAGLT